MWTYYPELLERPVPRYTSYPTAAEFHDGFGPADMHTALGQVSGRVSLYLHIPFCQKICWYCGCNTSVANRSARLTGYLEALHREIDLVAAALSGPIDVGTIAFGGGSPNAISPKDFVRLVQSLTLAFGAVDPQWSIELDPRTLTEQWQQTLAGVRVRRASLGVQTFAPRLQQAIGRVQPDALIARSVEMLRGAGVTSLNFDLMYGLPGQGLGDLAASLQRSVELGADRLAVFGYAHVPHMIARQRKIDAADLPDALTRFEMARLAHDYLTGEGYVAVGFDHFARPGDPLAQAVLSGRLHRNFQGFTEDAAQVLIGLGASAISSFPDRILQNEKNAGRYRMMISQDRLPITRGVRRTLADERNATIIEALLCRGRARIDVDRMAAVWPGLAPYAQRGLCRARDGELVIEGAGLPYARSIAAQFDPYRQQSLRQFSSAI